MDDFNKESDFEAALITALQRYGWEKDVLKNPTEQDLLQNWANILFENNRDIDRLGDYPLIQEEMEDLLEQIRRLRTPLKLDGFINGKTVSITRKNPDDTLHYGKEVSLKIYDRMEIAAGQSRYQIVQQPRFVRHEKVLQDRRGDLMLLINGMPVFHIELKKSSVPVIEAANQIEKNHTLSEEYEYILQIGEIVNREERAKQLVQSLEQQVNQGRELGLSQGKKPLALIVELEGKDLRLYNETTLAGNIIEQVGGELLLPQEERTGYEELITLNPDVLFVVIVESEYKNADKIVARLYNNPALQSLTSVKNHSIKILPLYAVYSPGIRVKDGIQIIVDGLYPELAKEGPHEKLVTGN